MKKVFALIAAVVVFALIIALTGCGILPIK